ncbi:MAG TPA: histidine kinase [Nocardioides sp.]|nr:histidine kinase [Nocardioides sp.]
MHAQLQRWKARIEAHCLEHGLLYAWYVPLVSFAGQLACVLIALQMRDALWPIGPLHLALALVSFSGVVQIGFGRWLPWYLDVAGGFAAGILLLSVAPDSGLAAMDAAPPLLLFLTAETTARDGMREGAVVGGISAAILGGASIFSEVVGLPLHVLTVLVGYVVGAMLHWQMRATAAERAAREQAWQQATMAERQRIAREIHDLVAHSLSVTLLQVTGARHALRDLRGAESLDEMCATADEVDAALGDAEEVGRQAMADIRRTVSTLAEGPSPTAPLPGAAGIATLVEQFRGAGVDVAYDEVGDLSRLPAPTGLGLYRIAQESLSNAVKHAPSTPVTMRLVVEDRAARLEVSNPVPVGVVRRGDGLGSGLAGMQARADQLGAVLRAEGVDGRWVVAARVPLAPAARACQVGLMGSPAPAKGLA